MKQYPSLKSAYAKENFEIELLYENGEKRVYDFKNNLAHPFYRDLNDLDLFSRLQVVQGELIWDSGQDFCPYTLYEKSIEIK